MGIAEYSGGWCVSVGGDAVGVDDWEGCGGACELEEEEEREW